MEEDNRANVIITGHTSGLGKCLHDLMLEEGWNVDGWSPETGVDVSDPATIEAAVWQIHRDGGEVDILINCAGVNYINWHEDTPIEEWDRLMNTNARAPWLITKELLKAGAFAKTATILNVVSNASHMPMTNSAAYNASKGAAHILTMQMNRELKKRHDITVFGISPNRMAGTRMSAYIDSRVCELRGWTPEEARAYQLGSIPAGEETDPAVVAEFINFLLSRPERHKYLAGCIIPYGV